MENPWIPVAAPAAEERAGPADKASDPERPFRLFLYAIGWYLAGLLATTFVSFIITMVYTASGRAAPTALAVPLSFFTVQMVILFSALHRAKIVGLRGDRRDGLGLAPMRRFWLLLLLAAVMVGYLGLIWTIRAVTPLPKWAAGNFSVEACFATCGVSARAIIALCMITLPPVAEEFFFRGWLWTGLRRFWKPWPTIVGTGVFWMALHLLDDITLPLRLLPQAIIFSLARHYCGSVYASMALHALNNMVSVAMLAWLYLR